MAWVNPSCSSACRVVNAATSSMVGAAVLGQRRDAAGNAVGDEVLGCLAVLVGDLEPLRGQHRVGHDELHPQPGDGGHVLLRVAVAQLALQLVLLDLAEDEGARSALSK